MAPKTKTKQKTGERPVVTFNKKGNFKAPSVMACVWTTLGGKSAWEVSILGVHKRHESDTREQAERAAKRAIPAAVKRALQVADKDIENAKKDVAACIARRKKLAADLAGWL